jgi:hypothetical protein
VAILHVVLHRVLLPEAFEAAWTLVRLFIPVNKN